MNREDIQSSYLKIIKEEKIPYTPEGLTYLYKRMKDDLSIGDGVFEITRVEDTPEEIRASRHVEIKLITAEMAE